ncbi:DedA family protein [Sphingomonas sp. MMS24-J13]|uniref:DedA family protein n=1 Tax=Sphingomonas sp. MMS24-J13 TaxID=3238686 RepID=UPI00384A4F2F
MAAIFVGAGIEGEAVAITGGVLAQNGLLPVWGVVVAAGVGACIADQLWFWLARHYEQEKWVKRVEKRPAFQRALRILEHHLILFTLSFRFIYGMRTVTPIAISASHIQSRTFVMLNAISAAVWAVLMVWGGFLFGKTIDPWLHRIKSATLLIFAAGAVVLAIAMSPRLLRWWQQRQSEPAEPGPS